MQGPLRGFHHDLDKIFSQVFVFGPLRESHKIVKKEPAAAGADLARS